MIALARVLYKVVPIMKFAGITATTTWMWKSQIALATTRWLEKGIRSFVAVPQPAQGQKGLVEPHAVVTAGMPLVVISPVDHRAAFDLLRSLCEMARVPAQLLEQPTEIIPAFEHTPKNQF